MNLYRLPDGLWVGTKDAYKIAARERGMATTTPEPVEVPITPKEALIDFLNALNAERTGEPAPAAEPVPDAPAPDALNVYDQFDALPSRVQMELGVRAFDNTEKLMGKMIDALKARSG